MRPTEVNRELLAQNELLAFLNNSDQEALMACAIGQLYRAGENVFRQNEPAYAICSLLSGRVGPSNETAPDRHVMVDTVNAGRLFAWSGPVRPHRFPVTARAIEDVEVAVFRTNHLRQLFDSHPHLGYKIMQELAVIMASRIGELHQQLAELMGRQYPGVPASAMHL